MLISALCDYYDELAKDGKLVPECYKECDVHYLIALNPDGRIDDIIDWRITEKITGKKTNRKIILPLRTQKSTFDFNMVEHRPQYIFGLNFDGKESIFSVDDKTIAKKSRHAVFRDESLKRIEGLDSPIVNAFRNFLQSWIPEQETENPLLKSIELNNKTYCAFCLSGRPDILLHEDSQIKEVWERYYFTEKVSDSKVMAQCAITGEKNQPIAKIHRKISGIPGGQKTLVCCKTSAGWSYGNEKSYNSNISEAVMKKYTAALDYLLKDRKHKQQIDDITVLFWAEGGEKNDECVDFLNMFLFGSDSETADKEETDRMLLSLMSKAREGRVSEETINAFENIDENVNFYIVGLKPNAYRISLKFIYRRRLGAMLSAIAEHQADMQIIGSEFRNIPLWRLKNELKSPKSSKENIDTSLMTLLFKAIIYGTPYPNYLLSAMVTRIKTDRSINYVRAGTLKAFINRKARASGQKEEFKLALDKQNNNQAYLCGRLFSVLEHIQQSASSAKLNRTIKDAYFSSAASKPALVFPKLISLSQHHMRKLSEGSVIFYNKLIEEIIEKLDGEFPDTLMLTDQGRFMIGYYQQDKDFYEKQSDKSEEEK